MVPFQPRKFGSIISQFLVFPGLIVCRHFYGLLCQFYELLGMHEGVRLSSVGIMRMDPSELLVRIVPHEVGPSGSQQLSIHHVIKFGLVRHELNYGSVRGQVYAVH